MTEPGAFNTHDRFYRDYLFYRGKVACMEESLERFGKCIKRMNQLHKIIKRRLNVADYKYNEGATEIILPLEEYRALLEEIDVLFYHLSEEMDILGMKEDDHR